VDLAGNPEIEESQALRDDIELVVAKELRSSVRSAGRGLRRSLGA